MLPTNFGLGWNVKKWFFDRDRVLRVMDKVTRESLAKAGAQVRMIARWSMRYVTSLPEGTRVEMGDPAMPNGACGTRWNPCKIKTDGIFGRDNDPRRGHHGTGDLELTVRSLEDIEKAKLLIRRNFEES